MNYERIIEEVSTAINEILHSDEVTLSPKQSILLERYINLNRKIRLHINKPLRKPYRRFLNEGGHESRDYLAYQ